MTNHPCWWNRLGLLCIVSMLLLSGCSSATQSEPLTPLSAATITEPEITVVIDGGGFVPSLSEVITVEWKQGMTISQALANTGTVKLKNDASSIATVGDIALDPKMTWGLILNDNEIRNKQKLNDPINLHDQLTVYVKELDVESSSIVIPNITLTIDGGTSLPDITSTYALPLEQQVKLVDVLNEFGNITLSKDHEEIVEINHIDLKNDYVVEIDINGSIVLMSKLSNTVVDEEDHIKITIRNKE